MTDEEKEVEAALGIVEVGNKKYHAYGVPVESGDKPVDNGPAVPLLPKIQPAQQKWECRYCEKPFMRILRNHGAMKKQCEECSTPQAAYMRKIGKSQKAKIAERAHEELPKLIDAMIMNPGISVDALSLMTAIPYTRVNKYIHSNAGLAELRRKGSRKVAHMIPKALAAMDQILDDPEHKQRFAAAAKILDSERVTGPTQLDVNVSVARKSIEELRKVVAEAAALPAPTILEANLISAPDVVDADAEFTPD